MGRSCNYTNVIWGLNIHRYIPSCGKRGIILELSAEDDFDRYHFSCPISRQFPEVLVSIDALTQAWSEALAQISDQLRPATLSFLRSAKPLGDIDGTILIAVPNEVERKQRRD